MKITVTIKFHKNYVFAIKNIFLINNFKEKIEGDSLKNIVEGENIIFMKFNCNCNFHYTIIQLFLKEKLKYVTINVIIF